METRPSFAQEKDSYHSNLNSVDNELPPVYTEVWDEKGQPARDGAYEEQNGPIHERSVQGQQGAVSGYDSKIATAAMSKHKYLMNADSALIDHSHLRLVYRAKG